MLLCACVPVSSRPPLIPLLFPARLPPLPLCSEGCSTVTHGWRTQEKKKSCLATTWRDAMPLFALHPLTSHARYPHVFQPPPPPPVDCYGGILVVSQCFTLWLIWQTQLGGEEKAERRMSRWERKREGWHLLQRCCACMLPASCSSSLLLCRRNRPSLQTASLPVCITTENLGLPQRAVISRTKNTRWRMCHMPGYRHTLRKEHNGSRCKCPSLKEQ